MKYFFLLLSILFIPGCSTMDLGQILGMSQTQKLNPAVYYRNDICFDYEVDKDTAKQVRMKGDFNEVGWGSSFGSYTYHSKGNYSGAKGVLEFCGVGVLPYKPYYKMKVKSPGKLNFFALTSCHEEDTTENPDRGIFKKNGELNIKYKPTLERGLACPLYVSAYSKQQKHAFGAIGFEHPRYQLDATLECNGYKTNAHGVSMCQSRQGLIQRITFNEPVKAMTPVAGAAERQAPCPTLPTEDNMTFLFKLPPRECIYGFIGIESRRIHQFYTIGYEEIIVRD